MGHWRRDLPVLVCFSVIMVLWWLTNLNELLIYYILFALGYLLAMGWEDVRR